MRSCDKVLQHELAPSSSNIVQYVYRWKDKDDYGGAAWFGHKFLQLFVYRNTGMEWTVMALKMTAVLEWSGLESFCDNMLL